ncbi:disulfide bond formation protein DsbA [Loktanella sp. 3ANDIMAR09]|uniref:DsbA family protein n=1 Tax=Loktanella sp. 3ANDIMAR09 TaxID=1225657 RepID=UPI0006F75D83|nr:DsbA family protein [Loktanella sp. 3ANDIMAR09]KQI68643.1 disulfide bond formation protein DsbA [Loktanella sp. 3ANDIMAR09]
MRLAFAALAALTIALPAQAQTQMSEAERDAFRAEVRAYLMENPEVIMEAIDVLQAREEAMQAQADAAMVQSQMEALTNDGFSFVDGNPDGDITIVEFMDYRCGYCKRAFPEVETLLSADGNIRLIVKEFPILGEESVLASRFAIATKMVAGNDAYKAVHDTLMALNGSPNIDTLVRLGNTLGLDTEAITAMMNDDAVTQVIANNHALGQALRISGTPTFVVADQMVRGYVPADQLQQLVDDLRS